MNVSKLSLFLLMSAATTIALCDEPLTASYTMRVGDHLEIPVGPTESGSHPTWYYNIMNPEQVYAHLNPNGASNILETNLITHSYFCSFFKCLLDYFLGKNNVLMQSHWVEAMKPGITTIIYNRAQTLDGCGCDKFINWETVDKEKSGLSNELWEKVRNLQKGTLTQEYQECKAACESEAEQQKTKPYKAVTITVLPAE